MRQCPSAASAGTVASAIAAATTTGKLQFMAATHSTLSLLDQQAAAAQEKAERIVVGVFLSEEQCVKKKEDLLPLAASSSSPSLSCSSICDTRKQSSFSSQGSEFGGDLPVNEVTWPELAHQYLVTFMQGKSGNPSGLRPEERKRFIRCLQRDGGVLFGAAATVAVESDAQVMIWFWCGLYVGCSMFTIIG
jgi:hypothetical protein